MHAVCEAAHFVLVAVTQPLLERSLLLGGGCKLSLVLGPQLLLDAAELVLRPVHLEPVLLLSLLHLLGLGRLDELTVGELLLQPVDLLLR